MWTRSPEGNGSRALGWDVASAFAHVAFAATPTDEVRGIAWLQRVTTTAFEDRGVHELKGIPGEWRLYAAV